MITNIHIHVEEVWNLQRLQIDVLKDMILDQVNP